MLKLKLQSFGHLMRRADSLEKTMMLGKTEGRRSGRQKMTWSHSITDSMERSLKQTPGDTEPQESPLQSMGLQRVRHDLATE